MQNNHFDTQGPFGLPLKDQQAKALDQILADLPRDDAFTLRRLTSTKGLAELLPEARGDVSWISVEAPDHVGDLVRAAGMDDALFRLNPIVTLNHSYNTPPVGRSLWRKKIIPPRRGVSEANPAGLAGIKAKTLYPPRPADWSGPWPADLAFQLIEAGLLRGKSIGFLPLQLHQPTAEEIAADPRLKNVRAVIDRWLLLEYACCFLPTQPLALVEDISKSLPEEFVAALWNGRPQADSSKANDASPATAVAPAPGPGANETIPFLTWDALEKILPRFLASPDFANLVQRTYQKTFGVW